MRRAARTDANHAEIAEAFRKVGCSVQSLHQLGGGVPDLMVAKNGMTALIEVKTPNGKETLKQKEWAKEWKGLRYTISHVDSVPWIAADLWLRGDLK